MEAPRKGFSLLGSSSTAAPARLPHSPAVPLGGTALLGAMGTAGEAQQPHTGSAPSARVNAPLLAPLVLLSMEDEHCATTCSLP